MKARNYEQSPSDACAKLVESELCGAEAKRVRITNDKIVVELADGRMITVPLKWYPRLVAGTPRERRNVRISGNGLHWSDLDEDLSIRGILLGRKSGESTVSLNFWLDARKKGRKVTVADYMAQRTPAKKAGAKRKRSA